jgi:hypothetical protein
MGRSYRALLAQCGRALNMFFRSMSGNRENRFDNNWFPTTRHFVRICPTTAMVCRQKWTPRGAHLAAEVVPQQQAGWCVTDRCMPTSRTSRTGWVSARSRHSTSSRCTGFRNNSRCCPRHRHCPGPMVQQCSLARAPARATVQVLCRRHKATSRTSRLHWASAGNLRSTSWRYRGCRSKSRCCRQHRPCPGSTAWSCTRPAQAQARVWAREQVPALEQVRVWALVLVLASGLAQAWGPVPARVRVRVQAEQGWARAGGRAPAARVLRAPLLLRPSMC